MLSLFVLFALFWIILYLKSLFNKEFFIKVEKWIQELIPEKLKILRLLECIFSLYLFIPAYKFEKYAAYSERLKPFVWCFSIYIFILLCVFDNNIKTWMRHSLYHLQEFIQSKYFFFISLFFLLVLIFIIISGWGISGANESWYTPGIPIQTSQLISCIMLCLLFLPVNNQIYTSFGLKREKIISFFIIWICSAIIWRLSPLKNNFFAPGPYPPNYEYYPYSDAIFNDLAAYTAEYGQKFGYANLVLKPIVTFVRFFCNLLANNDVNQSMYIQSALFASLPAFEFLFASYIAGNFCGFLAAGLLTLQEWNALHTEQVLTITSRLMMSEFLLEILFVLFGFFVFKWFRMKNHHSVYAAAAGGMTSLAIYTRYNFYGMIPAILVFGFIASINSKRKYLADMGIYLLSIVISISPWVYRSYQIEGKILPEITGAFSNVVVGQRLMPLMENKQPVQTDDQINNENKLSPDNSATLEKEQPASPKITDESEDKQIFKLKAVKLNINPLLDSIGNHTLHNLVGSFLILPLKVKFDDLNHIYTASDSIWKNSWDGSLTIYQWILLVWNIFMITIANVFLIKKFGFCGLLPIYLWFCYSLCLGISRTSAGRYIVPLNWVIILMFSVAVSVLFNKEKISPEVSVIINKKKDIVSLILIFLSFFSIYGGMFLLENLISDKMPHRGNEEIIEGFESSTNVQLQKVDWTLVRNQVDSGDMIIGQGYMLYPRFYYFRKGEHGTDAAFAYKEYSRIVFPVVENNKWNYFSMPVSEIPDTLQHNTIIYFIACKEPSVANVLSIEEKTKEGETLFLVRDPLSAFSCPVQEPVCQSVNECK